MSPSLEPLIVVSRPCPRRAGAIERLVAATLDAPDREAIERHLKSCPRCRGYREWLRLEARTARSLAGRTAARVSIEKVRHDLEQQIAHLRAAEAAQALVRLAEWYIIRREDADPRIYTRSRPRPRTRSERQIQEILEQWRAAPWSAARTLSPAIDQRASALVDHPDLPNHRTTARAFLDLAIDIEPACYRARSLRADLIGEVGYGEQEQFERDVDVILGCNAPLMHAAGLSLKARYQSMVKDDVAGAARLLSQAADLTPKNPDDRFSAWLLYLVLEDRSRAPTQFRRLASQLHRLPRRDRCNAGRRRAYLAALDLARDEGYLAQSVYQKWSTRTRDLIHVGH